jgi:tRNA U54 and U55 pseudouridine synthase Pus10
LNISSLLSVVLLMKTDPSEPPEIPEDNLTCDICGQKFDTVESLREHKLSEVKDSEMKHKGID